MSPRELHEHFRVAVNAFTSPAESEAVRDLIEAGGVENFLSGLLFIRLRGQGHQISREFPIGNHRAADLTLHDPSLIHVELKQLNLKDGCSCAPQNLINDLLRHGGTQSLGILYVSDERSSTTVLNFQRFGGANRRAKHDVSSILVKLPNYFGEIYPDTAEKALLRNFPANGGLGLYGFVVAQPLLPSTKA